MVSLTLNLKKRDAIFLAALLVFSTFSLVYAYDSGQPTVNGHSANEIHVWSTLQGKYLNLYDFLTDLETRVNNGGGGSSQITTEVLPQEFINSSTNYGFVHGHHLDSDFYKEAYPEITTLNALATIKIKIISSSNDECPTNTVLTLSPTNYWRITCDQTGIIPFLENRNDCSSGRNWISFDADGWGVRAVHGKPIEYTGIRKLDVTNCDNSGGEGTITYEVNFEKIALKFNGQRLGL